MCPASTLQRLMSFEDRGLALRVAVSKHSFPVKQRRPYEWFPVLKVADYRDMPPGENRSP